MHLGTFHGNDPLIPVIVSRCTIASLDSSFSIKIHRVLIVPELQLSPRYIDWPTVKKQWPHLANLDLRTYNWENVEMFIGANAPAALRQYDIRPAQNDFGPEGILTPFGWTIMGTIQVDPSTFSTVSSYCHVREESDDLAERYWSNEVIDNGESSMERIRAEELDKMAMTVYSNTILKRADGHYQLGLPFIPSGVVLPNNRPAALRRLYAVESRFRSDPEYARKYTTAIETYVNLGFAKRLPREELNGPQGRTWYLPHFLVVSPNKPDKPRLVFDAASRYQGVSLNDALHSGPVVLASLYDLLIMFRENPVAVSMDIEKMFLQIRVREEDQSVFRFFWRRPGEGGPPIAYQMMVEVFGASSSPTSAAFVLHRTADDNPSFKDVAEKVKTNFYVDNYLDSFDSITEAVETSTRLQELLRLGGFNLGQLASSSRELLRQFNKKDWAKPCLNIDLDDLPMERALGIMWKADSDEFTFELRKSTEVKTKRQLLAAVSSVFDPLGLLACVVIVPRILLQDVWRIGKDERTDGSKPRKLAWDDRLPESLLRRWNRIEVDFQHLSSLRIPRSIRTLDQVTATTILQLHICCDASVTAYGAMVFLRCSNEKETSVRLITAKSRVAPVKQTTIPRLELMAALLGVRLGSRVFKVLRKPIASVTYWTDSRNVLYWLRSEATFYNPFIANRKERILELSEPAQWRHVPGEMNPADDVSRGIKAKELTRDHRFYCGGFLNEKEEKFPVELPRSKDLSDLEIVRPVAICTITVLKSREPDSDKIKHLISQAVNLTELKRAVALLSVGDGAAIGPDDLKEAMNHCISAAQGEAFKEDVKALSRGRALPLRSSLRKLAPYIDQHGVMRVGGRLEHSTLQETVKHPAILSSKHNLTRLVILDAHMDCIHGQTERTLYEVRAQYWVIAGRRTVRRILGECMECRVRLSKPVYPFMAPLPPDRLKPFLPAFTATGIDYFGPLYVTVRRSSEKRYGVLFTCLATRAVHIEIARQLDVDSFLMAWRRFIALRGSPAKVWSDNGTNLVAGEQELRLGIERLEKSEQLEEEMTNRGVHWHFSPPLGPHFGGIWERMVRSAKTSLRIVLGINTVSEEVLSTVMAEVTSMLNARPLTHLSVDPEDESPLTPNHILLGRAHPHIPPDLFDTKNQGEVSRRRWLAAQELSERFWRRWLIEYVPALTERSKWTKEERNLAVGDLVLLVDPSSPRGHWPTGRVSALLPARERRDKRKEVVREVMVRTASGEYRRPVVKLCLLRKTEEAEAPTGSS